MTSAYGKDNYDSWINKNKDKIIYDKDDGIIKKRVNGQWLQLPNAVNSSDNNISQSNSNVKSLPTVTNSDTQEIKKICGRHWLFQCFLLNKNILFLPI